MNIKRQHHIAFVIQGCNTNLHQLLHSITYYEPTHNNSSGTSFRPGEQPTVTAVKRHLIRISLVKEHVYTDGE